MDASLKQLHDQIDDATAGLLETLSRLTDDDVRRPSLLPGWTRAHVATHLARGGEALANLLRDRPAYVSREARDTDIEAGSTRGAAELVADVRASAAAFLQTALAQPDDGWDRVLTAPGVGGFPAGQVLVRRLVELELHHVDLDAGYRSTDWPTTFNELELVEPMRTQRADRIV